MKEPVGVVEPHDCPHEHTPQLQRICAGEEHYLDDNTPQLPRFLPSAACLATIGIVRACQQTNNEAIPLLLAANTWRVTGLEKFRDNLLGPLTPGRAQNLRKLHLEVKNYEFFQPLQVGEEDDCYLHIELARIFCSDQPALRALHELQIFLFFENEDDRYDSETDKEDFPTSGHGNLELQLGDTRDTLILQRAMYNLVRLGLFDQHQLTTSLDLMESVDSNNGEVMVRKYMVSLTRTSTKQV